MKHTMTNFKEHEGQLFRMLEEPVPLTPDAEMPCLVRLIQDDSPMGKLNKDLHAKVLTPKICTEVIDVNDLSDHNRGSVRYDEFISCLYYYYELIGTFVEEGSEDWALYQMMQGKKVTKQHLQDDFGNIYWCFYDRLRCVQEFNCGTLQITVIPEIWIKTADKDGWQIYKEPKPEPQYKVGDWVEWCGDQYMIESAPPQSGGRYDIRSPYDELGCSVYPESITRKLSPSEVVIPVNISGTVRQAYNEDGTINDEQFQLLPNGSWDGTEMFISFDALDTQTRELVEGLLEEQDEEKLKGDNND